MRFEATGLAHSYNTFRLVMSMSWKNLMARKASWVGLLVFALALLVLFPFALGADVIQKPEVRYGPFWMMNEFVVVLIITRMFTSDTEGGALEYLLSSRASRFAILWGKIAFSALQLFSLQVPLLIFWIFFYNIPASTLGAVWPALLGSMMLFSLGTASLGALINCATARSVAREILIPILFYPLQMTVLIGCVTLCMASDPYYLSLAVQPEVWWSVLGVFPVIFVAVGAIISHQLLQE